MSSPRTTIAATAVLAVLAGAAPTVAAPSLSAGPGPGHFSSDNVQWLSVNPRHTGTSGGRLHEGYFYVTDPRGVYIYDVRDPAQPVLTGSLPVFMAGTFAALGQEDPDTNGEILLLEAIDPNAATNANRLLVIDVSVKSAPRVMSSIATADHTWTCVADCKYAYGRSGTIVDLTDPADPKAGSTGGGNWKNSVSGSGYTHDFTEVAPNRLMSAGQPSFYLDTTDPLKPKKLTTIKTTFPSLGYHGAAWPQGGKDRFLIMGTEIAPAGTNNLAGSDCQGDGELATYDTTAVLAAEQRKAEYPEEAWGPADFTKAGSWRIAGRGTYADGKAPFHVLYCGHWFDPHPNFGDGGLIAKAHYEWGTRFLNVDPDGKISEVGWFQPVGGSTASAYWIGEDIVYAMDYRRGMDVLRFTGATSPAPEPNPDLRTERVYFACGASRVANADNSGASLVYWDTTAPTQPSMEGAGCGSVDSPFTQSAVPNIYDTTFQGTFTGNLDRITVEAHNLYAGYGRVSGPMSVSVRLIVDGESLTPGNNSLGAFVTLVPVRSSTGLTESFRFSITDIGFVSETDSGEHLVQLVLHGGTRRAVGPTVTDSANTWVYDAADVPSGITFNPPTVEATRIKANRPPPV